MYVTTQLQKQKIPARSNNNNNKLSNYADEKLHCYVLDLYMGQFTVTLDRVSSQ